MAALGVGVALGVQTLVASAQESLANEGPVIITWQAPAGCPDRETLARRLADVLAEAAPGLGAGWQVDGRIEPHGQAWQLQLGLLAPGVAAGTAPAQRVLSARSCDDLVEAAAVAIAIALDDAERAREPAAPDAPAPSSGAPEPGPPASAAATAGDAGELQPDATPPGSSEPIRMSLALDGVLDSASLGGLSGGVSLEVAASLRRLVLGAYGLWLPPRTTELGGGQGAEFSLLGGGLRACYQAPADWLWVAPCAGLELARFEADSAGLRQGRDIRDPWFAFSLGLGFGSRVLGAFGLHSRVELVLPSRRQEYFVDDQTEAVQRVPAATLRWLVGADVGAF